MIGERHIWSPFDNIEEGGMMKSDMNETAKIIVDRIILDLTDRRGLRQIWEQLDDEIQEEIRAEWERFAKDALKRAE